MVEGGLGDAQGGGDLVGGGLDVEHLAGGLDRGRLRGDGVAARLDAPSSGGGQAYQGALSDHLAFELG